MKLLASSLLFFAATTASHAAIVITAAEVGGDVVFTGSGSIDLTGAVPAGNINFGAPAGIQPNSDIVAFDAPGAGATVADTYTSVSVGNFGPGAIALSPIATGDTFFTDSSFIALPPGYTSGTPLAFTSTFLGTTFAGLGITTPGTFTWTLPSDTVTLVVGTVPEPSTYIAGAGLLGLGAMVFFRRRKQAMAAK